MACGYIQEVEKICGVSPTNACVLQNIYHQGALEQNLPKDPRLLRNATAPRLKEYIKHRSSATLGASDFRA